MSHTFNGWLGLGDALYEANEKWHVELMPEFLASVAEAVANSYARDPHMNFEAAIERFLAFDLPDITDAEMHAAKFVVGKVFAANRAESRSATQDEAAAFDDFLRRIGEGASIH